MDETRGWPQSPWGAGGSSTQRTLFSSFPITWNPPPPRWRIANPLIEAAMRALETAYPALAKVYNIGHSILPPMFAPKQNEITQWCWQSPGDGHRHKLARAGQIFRGGGRMGVPETAPPHEGSSNGPSNEHFGRGLEIPLEHQNDTSGWSNLNMTKWECVYRIDKGQRLICSKNQTQKLSTSSVLANLMDK